MESRPIGDRSRDNVVYWLKKNIVPGNSLSFEAVLATEVLLESTIKEAFQPSPARHKLNEVRHEKSGTSLRTVLQLLPAEKVVAQAVMKAMARLPLVEMKQAENNRRFIENEILTCM